MNKSEVQFEMACSLKEPIVTCCGDLNYNFKKNWSTKRLRKKILRKDR